jgi:hypothetical protein
VAYREDVDQALAVMSKDGTAPAFRVLQAQSRESAVEPPTAL